MICSRERQEKEEESNSEMFQENNVQEEEEEEEDERFDSGGGAIHQHHPISAAKHRPTTKTPDKCTACGCSMKRPSPSLQEPSPKRLSLLPPSPSLLYRSLSEPIDSLGILNAENSKIAPSPVKNSESRDRPPIPPLHRSLSDPTVALEFRPPLVPSPPRPIKSPPSSSAQGSPNTKRLKRMKDRLGQMRQWWDQVLQEEEDEDSYAAEDNNSKEEEKGEEAKTTSSSAGEESVWVEEKGGEGLVIHFKCPCKKGYEILLSGNKCYYKLM
ncbi:PREDICTED: swi5-dependent recombination DNA repair protein 1 homolog [Ipomoea nil]|uniref:swi5-dependent recombination DNA repair protein 1 homolog n=1 Tax=Ipomoea nil TaxID=35883 RepID=UPI000900CF44|nr:PREDICTED: swi5-dependent recombination DNA repair protein 1 homolog [Ipomoea nil]